MGIIKSFRTPKDEMLPVFFEILGNTTDEDFELFSRDQDKRLDLALGRMRLCSFTLGFMNPFGPPAKDCLGYSWCPHKEWKEYFNKIL